MTSRMPSTPKMTTRRALSIGPNSRAIIAQLRPHQWLHVMTISFLSWQLVAAQLKATTPTMMTSSGVMIWSYMMVVLAFLLVNVPAQLFLQDAFDRISDDEASMINHYYTARSSFRKRLSLVLSFMLEIVHVMLVLLLTSSIIAVLFFFLQLTCSLAYAGFKHQGHPMLASIGRALSGSVLLMYFMSVLLALHGTPTSTFESFFISVNSILVILFVGIMDATINLAGDIRDHETDVLKNIPTLVVVKGEQHVIQWMRILTACSIVILSIYLYMNIIDDFVILLTLMTLIMTSPHLFESFFRYQGSQVSPWRHWYHGIFHLSKLLSYFILSLTMEDTFHYNINTASILVILILTWFLAYWSYVNGKHQHAENTPKRMTATRKPHPRSSTSNLLHQERGDHVNETRT